MDKDIKNWCDISAYDIATAEAMYKGGRYVYVLFMCQQAVEKMLKGLILLNTGNVPPRLHDLERLATEFGKLELDEPQLYLLRALTTYYIGTRYPEDIRKMSADISKDIALRYLKETREMLKWLKTKFR